MQMDKVDRMRFLPRFVSGAIVMLIVLSLLLSVAQAGQVRGGTVYLDTDVVLTGRLMYSFTMAGQDISVVIGRFSMKIDGRKLLAENAVLWISEHRSNGRTLRDVEVYLEGGPNGNATIIEPDGTKTTDRVIFVIFHHKGRFEAEVSKRISKDCSSLPIVKRAISVRNKCKADSSPASKPEAILADSDRNRKTPRITTAPERKGALTTTKFAPKPYQRVSFRADNLTSREIPDPQNPKRKLRITIAKGNVYISHGIPGSDLFLEIRADAAVLYTAPIEGGKGPVPEKIVAAYMEGDVIIRRGERRMWGERLFYNFQTGRAIVIQPVLRTIQEQRNIPVYIRAAEARQLRIRKAAPGKISQKGGKWYFRDAIVTTSDFYTPGYCIAAKRAELQDTTVYDEKGVAVTPRSWRSKLTNATFNILSVPILWAPYLVGDAKEGHTALRRATVGSNGRFGWGAESSWYLFRLLGIPRPKGFRGTVHIDWYERGFIVSPKIKYYRETYSGFMRGSYLADREAEDDFGKDRKDIEAQKDRGRFLWRHRHFLPRGWQAQAEISYLSDRNFLEEFFPGEYWTGKEQETLIYVKKQKDNWAISVLGKWRINDFLTQTEAFPEIAGYLIGQSFWNDRLTFYGEGRAGIIRYRPDNDSTLIASDTTCRGDLRAEIDAPFAIGPVQFLPSIAGRITSWSDSPNEGGLTRPWGQIALSAMTHIWRIYDFESRLWDLHRLKYVITPYGGVFFSCTSVQPDRTFPFNDEVEPYIHRLGGGSIGVRQLWQTKRGPVGNRHIADWLRVNLSIDMFSDSFTHYPADGRYFFSRPEYSIPRNAINADAAWYISDATAVLADANYDIDSGSLARANIGVAVARSPRLKYYLGLRRIRELDSAIGTVGVDYQINRKYRISAFEQYDFDFDSGQNLTTQITLTRKFPRLYTAFTFAYDAAYGDVSLVISLWPEGIPEARIGGFRTSLLGRSEKD